jgi:hypothetical protein
VRTGTRSYLPKPRSVISEQPEDGAIHHSPSAEPSTTAMAQLGCLVLLL